MSFESSRAVVSADESPLGSDWRSVWALRLEAANSIAVAEGFDLMAGRIVPVGVRLDFDGAEGFGWRYWSWIGFWACVADTWTSM